MSETIVWNIASFRELTASVLYDIMHLRSEVFVVEQKCIFLDADFKDQDAHHLTGYINNKLIAYTRLFDAGIVFNEASIGRVVTSPQARNSGFGKILMKKSISAIDLLFGHQPIRIGAQLYLKHFYESFGFQQDSEIYLEDDIEHIQMILQH